jgi:hypothetical protein
MTAGEIELFCNDGPCTAPGCGATPVLHRCSRCGVSGMVTHCKHGEPSPPIGVSLTVDWPNETCDLCEWRQEQLTKCASKLLGESASDTDLTRFRRACNEAIKQKRPPHTRSDLSSAPPWVVAEYVWNGGSWEHAADFLLGEE